MENSSTSQCSAARNEDGSETSGEMPNMSKNPEIVPLKVKKPKNSALKEESDSGTQPDAKCEDNSKGSTLGPQSRKRKSHDESFWYQLCEEYKRCQDLNPVKNISQRAFLKSCDISELSGSPSDCRSFSRYLKRYEQGDLNPLSSRRRRRTAEGRSSNAGLPFAIQVRRNLQEQSRLNEEEERPRPKLLPPSARQGAGGPVEVNIVSVLSSSIGGASSI